MSHAAEATKTGSGDPDLLWKTLARIDGLEQWMPNLVARCSVEGRGAGATRNLTLVDGAELSEAILEIDEAARRFRYAVASHPFPARNIVGLISVDVQESGDVTVTWGAEFEIDEDIVEQVKQMMAGFYSAAIDALFDHCAEAAQ
ncbi:MAG: SRPBCC family protein [Paracoccaceae bacterium]